MTGNREVNKSEDFVDCDNEVDALPTETKIEANSESEFPSDVSFPVSNIINRGTDFASPINCAKATVKRDLEYSQDDMKYKENETSASVFTNLTFPTFNQQLSDKLFHSTTVNNESFTSIENSQKLNDWFIPTSKSKSECNTKSMITAERCGEPMTSLSFKSGDSVCLSSMQEAENNDYSNVRIKNCDEYSSPHDADTKMRQSPCQEGPTKNILSHIPLHTCERCGKQYRHAASLKNHCRKHDSGELTSKKFKCPYCVYSSQYNRNVIKHVEATHRPSFGSTQHSIFSVSPMGHEAMKEHSGYQNAPNLHSISKKEPIRLSGLRTHDFSIHNEDPVAFGTVQGKYPYMNSFPSGFGGDTVPSIYSFAQRDGYKGVASESVDDVKSSVNQKGPFLNKSSTIISLQKSDRKNELLRNGLEMEYRPGNALQRLLDVKSANVSQPDREVYGSSVPVCEGLSGYYGPIPRSSDFDLKMVKQTQLLGPANSHENGCQYRNASYTSDVYSFPNSTSNLTAVYDQGQTIEHNTPEANNIGQNRHENYCATEKASNAWLNNENLNLFQTQSPMQSFSFKHKNFVKCELEYPRSIVECDVDGSTSLSASLVGQESVDSYKKGNFGSAVEQLLCSSNDVTGYEHGDDDVKENNPFSSTPTLGDHGSDSCSVMCEFQSVPHQQVTSETDAFLSDLQEILSRDMPQLDKAVSVGPVDGEYSTESVEFSESSASGINSNQTISSASAFSGDSGIENMSSSSSCSTGGGSVTNSVWGSGAQDHFMKNGSPMVHSSISLCSSVTATNPSGTFASTPDDNQVYNLSNGTPSTAQSLSSVADPVGVEQMMDSVSTMYQVEKFNAKSNSPIVQAGYPRAGVPSSSHKQPQPVELPDLAASNGKAEYPPPPVQCTQTMPDSKLPFDAAPCSVHPAQRRDPSRFAALNGEYVSQQQPFSHDTTVRWRSGCYSVRPGLEPCCSQPQTEAGLPLPTMREPYRSYNQHHQEQQQQRNFYHSNFPNAGGRSYYEYASVTNNGGASSTTPTNGYDTPDHPSSSCIQLANSLPFAPAHGAMAVDQTPPELSYYNSPGGGGAGAVYRGTVVGPNPDFFHPVHQGQQPSRPSDLGSTSNNYRCAPGGGRLAGQPVGVPVNGHLPGRDEFFNQFQEHAKKPPQQQHQSQFMHGYGNSGLVGHTPLENARRMCIPSTQANQAYPTISYTESHKYYHPNANKPPMAGVHPGGYEQSPSVNYPAAFAGYVSSPVGTPQPTSDLIPGYASAGGHFTQAYQQQPHHPQAPSAYPATAAAAGLPLFAFSDVANYQRLQEMVPRPQEVIRPATNGWAHPANGAPPAVESGMPRLGYEPPGLLSAPPHRSDLNQQLVGATAPATVSLPVGQSPS